MRNTLQGWDRMKITGKKRNVLARDLCKHENSLLKRKLWPTYISSCSIFSAGHVQTGDISLLSASDFSLPNLCIERAKWMASQVKHQDTL